MEVFCILSTVIITEAHWKQQSAQFRRFIQNFRKMPELLMHVLPVMARHWSKQHFFWTREKLRRFLIIMQQHSLIRKLTVFWILVVRIWNVSRSRTRRLTVYSWMKLVLPVVDLLLKHLPNLWITVYRILQKLRFMQNIRSILEPVVRYLWTPR